MSLIRETIVPISPSLSVVDSLLSLSFINSKEHVTRLLGSNLVKLNDQIINKEVSLNQSDILLLLSPIDLEPKVNSNYSLVFEDDFILVVDKPAPLPIHPSGKYYFNTLTSILKSDFPNLDLFTVHRLDSETSGLVVFAKSKEVAKFLFKSFKSKKVQKTYLAIVYGLPPKNGLINTPLVQSSCGDLRNIMLPVAVGRKLITNYSLISPSKDSSFSLLEVSTLSGKKHQIRAHLSSIGFPIVGDKIYGLHPEKFSDYFLGRLSDAQITDFWTSKRQFLHCSKLIFSHPNNFNLVSFESKLAPDMLDFLN